MRISWAELDKLLLDNKTDCNYERSLPNLSENDFSDILHGKGNPVSQKKRFPEAFHSFIDECYKPDSEMLHRITEQDIQKFLKGKPDLSKEDAQKQLPDWLRKLYTAFLPKLANQLPPHCAWDHKIDLLPGKEPPYHKNRPFSPQEL